MDVVADHQRDYRDNRYVYPVISRRSRGLSIGVNVNPDGACPFRCVYCQIGSRPARIESDHRIDLPRLRDELTRTLQLATRDDLFASERFRNTPPAMRRLNDVALSGNGEPTASPQIEEVVQLCADVKAAIAPLETKLVLITNSAFLDQPRVGRALTTMDANQGEIWAKLDAGTEPYYREVNRSEVPFWRILQNIHETACRRPIVIQTLWSRLHGQLPPRAECEAYAQRLCEMVLRGAQIKTVHLHTVARAPAESWVEAVDNAWLDQAAALVREVTGLDVQTFYAK